MVGDSYRMNGICCIVRAFFLHIIALDELRESFLGFQLIQAGIRVRTRDSIRTVRFKNRWRRVKLFPVMHYCKVPDDLKRRVIGPPPCNMQEKGRTPPKEYSHHLGSVQQLLPNG